MKRETASQLVTDGIAKLDQALRDGKSDQLEKYLNVMSRFTRYSFGNLMLILMQREDATRVAGYTKWKELKRQVKQGETGIGILAPMRYRKKDADDESETAIRGFKCVTVFDISQTEGDELPEFAKAEGEPGDNVARIERVITNAGIQLVEAVLIGGANGCCDNATITVRPGLSIAERFRVLVHEHAHHLLRHCERKHELTGAVRETEAEAIAFVVSNALGIDSTTRSSDYIQLHRGDAALLGESLETIQKTANGILNALEAVQSGETPDVVEPPAADARPAVVAPPAVVVQPAVVAPSAVVVAERRQQQTLLFGAEVVEAMDESVEEPQADDESELRIGRADYEERREGRIERLEARAANARTESTAAYNESSRMASAIPFGQPILVGHHSEHRDRRYRERIHNKMGKSVELGNKAEYYAERAHAAESNGAISSDDPEAIRKLKEKLEQCEKRQAYMKNVNAAWRKAGKPKSTDLEGWKKVAEYLGVQPEGVERLRNAMAGVEQYSWAAPCESYELKNNNAEIRRLKARIEELKSEGQVTESSEVEHGVCRVTENVELNRIQLAFTGKPSDEVRTLLKSNGFRWSRYECRWQRQLNSAGRYAAKRVVEQL